MKPTLGLTGLTVNGMALIAPGAFLWLTFQTPWSVAAAGSLVMARAPERSKLRLFNFSRPSEPFIVLVLTRMR
jgi:hypothetical protein